ncbi:hypothetical protein FKB19_08125 [Salmonella enterica subsp. enterica serovar Typhimurium]|nr:hypothetical protein FKB19_08125 [Salmonella enterica subsp. enterica serovar Typhimurium]
MKREILSLRYPTRYSELLRVK